MRITIHTGQKITPFELHHGRKPRTELTNLRHQKRRRGGIKPHSDGLYKSGRKSSSRKITEKEKFGQ